MKKIFYISIVVFCCNYSSAQARFNNTNFTTDLSSLAFINGAAAASYASLNFAGKGILYPRTDLTTITGSNVVNATNNYDGLVVYNIGTGPIPDSAMGESDEDVSPGFYYYSNPTGTDVDSGVWTPLGSGGGSGVGSIVITDNTPVDTNVTTAATDIVKVNRLAGTADGVTTFLELGTTNLAGDTVKQFRKALIYNSDDELVTIATGAYDVATNKFVTGNGLMNLLLPAGTYSVELYYTSN
jgi:hypothetical protein